ncbi:MAG TPA: ABC transporter ATP-binding protein [Deinococcales bacterium]|nr:ABC transporter ATP-binding protein [Deinococcales bacterium]
MSGIVLKNVTRDYPVKDGVRRALEPISLDIDDDEFVCIIGPSGCGKTTLLNIMSSLDRDHGGSVAYTEPGAMTSYMFQESRLLPWLSVRDNLAFVLDGDRNTKDRLIDEWLDRVGLSGFSRDYPYQLSVGMQQRVAVARAMIVSPAILFLDEPFSALDELTAQRMRTLVLELCEELDCTVVLVTHNPLEAAYLADRLVIMSGQPGRIVDIRDLTHLGRPRDSGDPELWKVSREAVAELTQSDVTEN